jgi:carboxypeptidase Taq
VGRSREFWELNFPEAQATFPDQLHDVDAEAFWRGVNRVQPGFIRVEADELTYDFHIMLRVDIEAALVDGIALGEGPARGLERQDQGIPRARRCRTTAQGVLQDVHWSSGQIGTFCNYTIGNVMAGQLYETAVKDNAIADGLARADYAPLRDWMVAHVHTHGRRYGRDELLVPRHRPDARPRALHRAPDRQVFPRSTGCPMPHDMTARLARRVKLKDAHIITRMADIAEGLRM